MSEQQKRLADNTLQEWGTRLFYGMPAKGKKTKGGVLIVAAAAMAASAALTAAKPKAPWVSAAKVRGLIRAAVRPKAKQVLVKISGGGRGIKAIAAHFRYISRQGKQEAGGKGQTLELEDENGRKLSGAKAIAELHRDWQLAGGYIPEESKRKEAFNIVLSMPAGTPPELVRDAAKAFAQETFEGHKYVFVLHTDTDCPHVHLAVRAERSDGVRLNPRKADLQRWRETFAARLQDRGIDAVATRAVTRNVGVRPRPIWEASMNIDGGRRMRPARARSAESVTRARSTALEAWGQIAQGLMGSQETADQALGVEVAEYVSREFGVPLGGGVFERMSPGVQPGHGQGGQSERR
jgi:Relaxase/Mobilisation nuclease domain